MKLDGKTSLLAAACFASGSLLYLVLLRDTLLQRPILLERVWEEVERVHTFLESVPKVAANLKVAETKEKKFQGVVKEAERSAMLVLVY